MWHIYTTEYYSATEKKKTHTDRCHITAEPQKHCAKWKKPVTEKLDIVWFD